MAKIRSEWKRWAYSVVQKALRDGILKPKPCEQCGNTQADAHHKNYRYPLTINWLCRSCHVKLHAVKRRHVKELRKQRIARRKAAAQE